jgi:hypothetical protein
MPEEPVFPLRSAATAGLNSFQPEERAGLITMQAAIPRLPAKMT